MFKFRLNKSPLNLGKCLTGLFCFAFAGLGQALELAADWGGAQPIPTLQSYLASAQAAVADSTELAEPERNHIATTLEKLANSQGYYDVQVLQEDLKQRVLYRITPGKRYRIESIQFDLPKGLLPPSVVMLDLNQSDPLIADQVIAAEQNLKDFLEANYCLLKAEVSHAVHLNKPEKKARIVFTVAPPVRAWVGHSEVLGLDTIPEGRFQNLFPWRYGSCFHPKLIDKAYERIMATGLFSEVSIIPAKRVDETGHLPIRVTVKEGKPRTVKLGVSTSSYEPLALTGGWEHRNLTGQMDRLDWTGKISQRQQRMRLGYKYPWWRDHSQSLEGALTLSHENWRPYESWQREAEAIFHREINDRWWFNLGLGYQNARVVDKDSASTYNLANLEAKAGYKKLRFAYPLNPRGVETALSLKPYYDINDHRDSFVKLEGSYRLTAPFSNRVNFSQRFKWGLIPGEHLLTIPTHLRFYAGGAKSIRGYAYQEVGALGDKRPNGGDSLLETSTELKYVFDKHWAGTYFIDGGNVYDRGKTDGPWFLWGTGVGVHYDTGFGILKAELATPLTNRERVQKPLQFYLSLGEDF